jgi:hypothetical protein
VSAEPRKPTFQPEIVMSSRMVRACSTTASSSSASWSKTSAVSRIRIAVTTVSGWPPMAVMVATSPASPPAPLGSLALKLSTQAGGAGSAGASWGSSEGSGASARESFFMGVGPRQFPAMARNRLATIDPL